MFFLSYIRKILSNNHGFSLIELLASLVIFTIVVSTMYGFFVQASSNTKMSQNKTVAVNLARNALVYLQKREFEDYHAYFEATDESGYKLRNRPYTMGYCFDIDTECNDELVIDVDDFFNTVFATGEGDGETDTTIEVWHKVFKPEINGVEYRINVTFKKMEDSDSGRYLVREWIESDEEFSQRKGELAYKLNELIIPITVEVVWQDQGSRIQRTSVEGYIRNGKAYVDDE